MYRLLRAVALVCMTIAILGGAVALALAGVAADAATNGDTCYPYPPQHSPYPIECGIELPPTCGPNPWKVVSEPDFDLVEEYIQENGLVFCYVLVHDYLRRSDDPWTFAQNSCWFDGFDGWRCVDGLGTRSIRVYASSNMDAVTLFVSGRAWLPLEARE